MAVLLDPHTLNQRARLPLPHVNGLKDLIELDFRVELGLADAAYFAENLLLTLLYHLEGELLVDA
jgi:hypothetical protein